MRVLVVNGYAASNIQGRERYEEFRQHVSRVMKEIERQDVTQIDIIEKARQDLDEFLFEMHTEHVEPSRISNFDRLDFVFVAGDPSASPWSPVMRKLSLLAKMCMMTGKCFYGSGLGAGLLAFLCSTAGERLVVMNNQGRGSLIDNVQAVLAPPPVPASVATVGNSASMGLEVLLDTRTGDFFTFDRRAHTWVPHGNTGLMQHTSDHAHDYGSRMNTARAGTKTHRSELSQALYRSKRGDTKGCCRLEAINHPLFNAIATREFLVNCKSTWDLDDRINATGNNKYKVLVDSSRGPMLIEFGNCVGSHFVLSKEYPESCRLLRNFVVSKYESLKVHEHIDRSYVSAISGSARLKERLQLAQTKVSTSVAVSSEHSINSAQLHTHSELPTQAKTMTSGRTSPKRCRPVSAGPYRTTPKPPEAVRMIQTSRSMYPSSDSAGQAVGHTSVGPEAVSPRTKDNRSPTHELKPSGSSNQQEVRRQSAPSIRPHTARASLRVATVLPKNNEPEVESPATDEPLSASPLPQQSRIGDEEGSRVEIEQRHLIKAHRRIRVAQQNELDKPYCAIDKFNAMREAEKQQHKEMYYSVVNDAPYMSEDERGRLDEQKGKLKWVAGPFRTAVGKASTQLPLEAGVFARAPFVQKNQPFHIIQRRQLEAPSPPRRNHPSPPKPQLQQQQKRRPMSAAATTRRAQR